MALIRKPKPRNRLRKFKCHSGPDPFFDKGMLAERVLKYVQCLAVVFIADGVDTELEVVLGS